MFQEPGSARNQNLEPLHALCGQSFGLKNLPLNFKGGSTANEKGVSKTIEKSLL